MALVCLNAIITGAVDSLLQSTADTEEPSNSDVTSGETTDDHGIIGQTRETEILTHKERSILQKSVD